MISKFFMTALFSVLFVCSVNAAEEYKSMYVLETDEESAQESLDRVSGQIDLGFSSEEQSFKSKDHYAAGPFSLEKMEESKEDS